MSGVAAGTKKKMAVSADQFEDAEEETEDFSYGGAKGAEPAPVKAVAVAVPATKPAQHIPIAPAPIVKKETEKESASLLMNKPPKKTEEESVTRSTATSASTSPVPTKGGGNPLDALALACVAEESRKLVEPKPPKEGSKVKAEEISCTDVLCGRGGQSNHHPGNIFFRRLVRAKQEEYLKANKREKTVVAKDIVKLIRMLSPPGRFLKKDPKDESVYVDVGDVQARNKASQALREGAPELREELRDQHSRLNAQNGGGPEVKLPYHGNRGSAAAVEERNAEERAALNRKDREALAARAAAAQGMMLAHPHYSAEGMAAALRGADPPEGSDDEAEASHSKMAAMHAAVAEERARRLMMATGGGPHGFGAAHAHLLNPQLGLGGLGGPLGAASMNPYLAGHSPAAAQFQAAAALQAAGGSHLLSPQAMMMAAAAHQQPQMAAMLNARRAQEMAGSMESMGAFNHFGMNPLFMGGQARAAAHAPFQESMRLHELMNAAGNVNGKREREEIEREIDENYAKKLSRQYM